MVVKNKKEANRSPFFLSYILASIAIGLVRRKKDVISTSFFQNLKSNTMKNTMQM